VDTVSTYLSHESKESLRSRNFAISVNDLLDCSLGSDEVFVPSLPPSSLGERAPVPPPLPLHPRQQQQQQQKQQQATSQQQQQQQQPLMSSSQSMQNVNEFTGGYQNGSLEYRRSQLHDPATLYELQQQPVATSAAAAATATTAAAAGTAAAAAAAAATTAAATQQQQQQQQQQHLQQQQQQQQAQQQLGGPQPIYCHHPHQHPHPHPHQHPHSHSAAAVAAAVQHQHAIYHQQQQQAQQYGTYTTAAHHAPHHLGPGQSQIYQQIPAHLAPQLAANGNPHSIYQPLVAVSQGSIYVSNLATMRRQNSQGGPQIPAHQHPPSLHPQQQPPPPSQQQQQLHQLKSPQQHQQLAFCRLS